MRIINRFLHITIILIIFASLHGCEEKQGPGKARDTAGGPLSELMNSMNIVPIDEATPAPEFELLSIDGRMVNLREYRGNVILLSFWATW
jgi:hypothetical protein